MVKFLGARKESAERIGVLGVNFFGYEVKLNCPLNDDLHLVKFGAFFGLPLDIVKMKMFRYFNYKFNNTLLKD